MTRFEPYEWLLSNGEIVNEPPLEQTSSGIKVRVAGTKESWYSKDLDALLLSAVKNIAAAKNASVFLALAGAKHEESKYLPDGAAKLHLTNNTSETKCWWKFKHPSMPYPVTLVVTLAQDHYSKVHRLTGYFVYPVSRDDNPTAFFNTAATPSLVPGQMSLSSNQGYKWTEWLRDNPPAGTAEATAKVGQYPVSRKAVEELLATVRHMEALGTIEWPDVRDRETPANMELELFDSNVNSQFVADLTDYLDGAPTAERAAELYKELLTTINSLGIVTNRGVDNDFLRALNSSTTFTADVEHLADEEFEIDHDHKIAIHIPSGTFIVECNHHEVSNDTIAEKWEEANTIAALTGEADELLAYARKYAETAQSKRTKRILSERGL